AERLVLCDTNGGFLDHQVERVIGEVGEALDDPRLGAHFHNDTGMAVANSLTAVRNGAVQVQGCVNGYGERTGNADLCSVIPNLALKMGIEAIPQDRLPHLTRVSHHIAEIINLTLDPHLPYVGSSAFTHKAGLHTSALERKSDAYEHLDPGRVGNSTRVVVSELAGRSTVLAKARAQGLDVDDDAAQAVVERIKEMEHEGYQFEAADGSFELLLREASGWKQDFFDVESYRVYVENRGDDVIAEATVKIHIGDDRVVATSEGQGPVSALDRALRQALAPAYPAISGFRLTDFRVRDLDSSDGTSARVRVLVETSDGDDIWGTVGVHVNMIDASWKALIDGIVIGLVKSSLT
ncbi:MAG: citramalate synthase, partial [Acidimicrobiia bacterium]|nr:citramalate synthase [Acidimicrobiia bacterium]